MTTTATAPALVRQFADYQKNILGHSDHTAAGYAADLGALLAWIADARGTSPAALTVADLAALSTDDIYNYMSASATGAPLSASTRCRRAASVRAFFRWLQRRGLIDRDPSADLETPKKAQTLPRYLTAPDCARLLDACPDGKTGARDRAILYLLISCGLRVSELCALDRADLGPDRVRVLGKGNKERVVFFGPACRAALDAWLTVRPDVPGEDALFLSNYRARIAPRSVQAMLDRRLTGAGLDPSTISPHKLRHTAATLMIKNGVDTRVVQEVLGHSNLNTTQIYTHVESDALRAAALAVPALG